MPSTVVTVSSQSLAAIDDLFDVEGAVAVGSYLEERPYLVPLLIEARRTVPRYFSDEPGVRLQLLADRDDLFAIIQTRLPEDRALEVLDRFDEDWWLQVAAQGRGRLTIDVETISSCSIGMATSISPPSCRHR